MLQHVIFKMTRNNLFSAFQLWSESIFHTKQHQAERRRQAKLVYMTLLKLQHSQYASVFAVLKREVAAARELSKKRQMATRLLRTYAFKNLSDKTSFALHLWKQVVKQARESAQTLSSALASTLSLSLKCKTFIVRRAFSKWMDVKRHYDYVHMHSNKQVVRMGNAFLKVSARRFPPPPLQPTPPTPTTSPPPPPAAHSLGAPARLPPVAPAQQPAAAGARGIAPEPGDR